MYQGSERPHVKVGSQLGNPLKVEKGGANYRHHLGFHGEHQIQVYPKAMKSNADLMGSSLFICISNLPMTEAALYQVSRPAHPSSVDHTNWLWTPRIS